MIDFKDCPKDETWLLFDSDGNCEFMADEIKLAYACYQIAKEKLGLVYEDEILFKKED